MAMDDSRDSAQRVALVNEAQELTMQLEQIKTSTEYNGLSLFDNTQVDNETETSANALSQNDVLSVYNLARPQSISDVTESEHIPPVVLDDDSGTVNNIKLIHRCLILEQH